jgi:hypothetical protein
MWHVKGISLEGFVEDNKEINPINPDKPKLEDFHKYYEVVFLDSSGLLNITFKMSLSTFMRIKHEASICLNQFNNEKIDIFDSLFIKNHTMELIFDSLIRFS